MTQWICHNRIRGELKLAISHFDVNTYITVNVRCADLRIPHDLAVSLPIKPLKNSDDGISLGN